MLKEVGASGQISLGKKYAGQLFDVQTAADGTITLMPVKVVPATHTVQTMVQEEPARYAANAPAAPDAPDAPAAEWAAHHADQITQYNAWAAQRQPYSQRVRQWRQAQKPAQK